MSKRGEQVKDLCVMGIRGLEKKCILDRNGNIKREKYPYPCFSVLPPATSSPPGRPAPPCVYPPFLFVSSSFPSSFPSSLLLFFPPPCWFNPAPGFRIHHSAVDVVEHDHKLDPALCTLRRRFQFLLIPFPPLLPIPLRQRSISRG